MTLVLVLVNRAVMIVTKTAEKDDNIHDTDNLIIMALTTIYIL